MNSSMFSKLTFMSFLLLALSTASLKPGLLKVVHIAPWGEWNLNRLYKKSTGVHKGWIYEFVFINPPYKSIYKCILYPDIADVSLCWSANTDATMW